MEKIVLVLVLLSVITKTHAQLHCFVCTNCPNVNDLNESISCASIPPINTPPTATAPTASLPTEAPTPPTPPTPSTIEISTPTTIEISTPTTIEISTPTTIEISTPTTIEISTPSTISISLPTTTERTSVTPPIATTPPQVPSQPSYVVNHKYKNVGTQQLAGTVQCFRIERRVGDGIEVDRGCVVAASTQHDTCVRANFGVTPIGCRICQFRECNNAKRYKMSIILMFNGIVAMMILR